MNLSAINTATKGKVRTTGVSPFLELELCKVCPNPQQPRKSFEDLEELASSIKANGLIQPIAVTPTGDGMYKIISGERRYRATMLNGAKTIKAHIISGSCAKLDELSLIENIQRSDLTDFEIAKFISQLWNSGRYGKKQDLAIAISKPPSYISKVFKAINLCDEIIADIEEHKKDIGLEVLQELSNIKDKEAQLQLYKDGAKRDDIRAYNENQKSSKKISPAKKYKELVDVVTSCNLGFLSGYAQFGRVKPNTTYNILIEEKIKKDEDENWRFWWHRPRY